MHTNFTRKYKSNVKSYTSHGHVILYLWSNRYLQQCSSAGAIAVSSWGQLVELSFAIALTSLSAMTVSASHSKVIKFSCVIP